MKTQHSTNDIIPQIKAQQLDAIISDNQFKIIDVRNPKGIETQGAIPNAINIPFETVDNALNPNDPYFNKVFNSEGPFLFCCTGGVMSYMAAIKAQEKGIKNVNNLEGGHSAWLKLKQEANVI